jgi:hypothetical protein
MKIEDLKYVSNLTQFLAKNVRSLRWTSDMSSLYVESCQTGVVTNNSVYDHLQKLYFGVTL